MSRACMLGALLALGAVAACSSTDDAPPEGLIPDDALIEREPIRAAHALWNRVKWLAHGIDDLEKDDPTRVAHETEIEVLCRRILGLLARDEFEPHSFERGHLRARLMFVIRPPADVERQSAVAAVDADFDRIMTRYYAESRPATG
jgi:hypothetical protein